MQYGVVIVAWTTGDTLLRIEVGYSTQHYSQLLLVSTTTTTTTNTTIRSCHRHCLPPSHLHPEEKNESAHIRPFGVEGLKRFTSSRLWSEDPEISPGWVWVVLLLFVCLFSVLFPLGSTVWKVLHIQIKCVGCTPYSLCTLYSGD